MDDTQHRPGMTDESPAAQQDDARGTATVVLGSARLLANPRRVRRA